MLRLKKKKKKTDIIPRLTHYTRVNGFCVKHKTIFLSLIISSAPNWSGSCIFIFRGAKLELDELSSLHFTSTCMPGDSYCVQYGSHLLCPLLHVWHLLSAIIINPVLFVEWIKLYMRSEGTCSRSYPCCPSTHNPTPASIGRVRPDSTMCQFISLWSLVPLLPWYSGTTNERPPWWKKNPPAETTQVRDHSSFEDINIWNIYLHISMYMNSWPRNTILLTSARFLGWS